MKNIRLILTTVFLLVFYSAKAVPAYPKPIKYIQPDGTAIEIILRGDEYNNWAETPDGYTLIKDNDSFWTFAERQKNGCVTFSKARYDGTLPNVIKQFTPKKLQPALTRARKIQPVENNGKLQITGTFPAQGKRKMLMLLINYGNTSPVFTQEDFTRLMNERGYNGTGSFRDYYLAQSYGLLDVETVVTPWITLSGDKSSYGSNGAIPMIIEALKKVDADIDLSEFDNDGDGILDGLSVIHQGKGQETTGAMDDIWSHSSEIKGISFDGIELCRYTIEPEMLHTGELSTIGVVCHEFGHNLGAPDFYDTDYGTNGEYGGTGVWDLLGSGAWNGHYGDCPSCINMWEKIALGWCVPTVLSETTNVKDMQNAEQTATAYRINTTVPGEYFILENRQQIGAFDATLPGSGLIVYHVNEKLIRDNIEENTLNAKYPQAIYTVCAGSGTDPDGTPSSYGDTNSGKTPFPGTENITTFADNTLPSTKTMNNRYSYFKIDGIKEIDGKVSFDYIKESTPQAPVNLKAQASKGVVTLSWDMPQGAVPDFYSIYINDELINTTTETTYTDTPSDCKKLITYSVDATYPDGLISPYAQTAIRVPDNKVKALSGKITGDDVELRWEIDNHLSRMDDVNVNSYSTTDVSAKAADFVHRFTATDMLTYKGYKITDVSFIPMLPPSEASYKVRIWQSDKNGQNYSVISECEVKEFGTLSLRDVPLTDKVTIIAGREYLIGIYCESQNRTISVVTDKNTLYNGYGNLMKTDNDWITCDNATGNFFINATLSAPTPNNPAQLPDNVTIEDPMIDLVFPIGYKIYRDGECIGTSGNSLYIDRNVSDGAHTYQVSSIYKADNESEGISIMLEKGTTDIKPAETESYITPGHAGLEVLSALDRIRIITTSGCVVFEKNHVSPQWIPLKAGMYIIEVLNKDCMKCEKMTIR